MVASSALLLAKAILAGFVVAMPIGAIGAMCLRRALHGRWTDGLITGFGAALADAILAAAAVFGLALVTQHLLEHKGPLRLVGGIVLVFLGIRMIRKRHPDLKADSEPSATVNDRWHLWLADVSTGFMLTIVNPATFLAFAGVFAGLGLFGPHHLNSPLESALIVLGAFTGSMLWWTVLTSSAFAVRHHVPLSVLTWINVGLGSVVLVLGLVSLGSLIPRS